MVTTAWGDKLEAPSAYAHIRWDGTDAPPPQRPCKRVGDLATYRTAGAGGGGFASISSYGRMICPGASISNHIEQRDDIVGPDITIAVLARLS